MRPLDAETRRLLRAEVDRRTRSLLLAAGVNVERVDCRANEMRSRLRNRTPEVRERYLDYERERSRRRRDQAAAERDGA